MLNILKPQHILVLGVKGTRHHLERRGRHHAGENSLLLPALPPTFSLDSNIGQFLTNSIMAMGNLLPKFHKGVPPFPRFCGTSFE